MTMTVENQQALALYRDAIVIDATCPVHYLKDHLHEWIEGRVTCCVATVATNHSAREAIGLIATWYRELHQRRDQLLLATKAEDIRRAKREGKLALVFQFQNTRPIEYDVDLLAVYHQLGVRVIQLTYNQRNPVGDGCEERSDAGLSELGRAAISEMNRLGILIDLNHTGRRTTLEAIEASTKPCVFTHSNAYAVCPNTRNITDEQIRAVAAKGGVIGVNGFPAFVAKTKEPTLDQLIDHIDYIVALVGPDHVGLGYDRDTRTMEEYTYRIRKGMWKAENYPPPPWQFPMGDASHFPTLTRRLLERGYTEEVVRKILGENFLRVFAQVWDV